MVLDGHRDQHPPPTRSLMRQRGQLAADADPEALALGLLAVAQGGLLLAQATRSVSPLQVALDLALDGIQAPVPTSPEQVGRPGHVRTAPLDGDRDNPGA